MSIDKLFENLFLQNKNNDDFSQITIYHDNGEPETISNNQLIRKVKHYSNIFRSYTNATVLINFDLSIEYFAILISLFMCKCVPIICRHPAKDIVALNNEIATIQNNIDVDIVVTTCSNLQDIKSECPVYSYRNIPANTMHLFKQKDYSFVQFTSGSTSIPRAICYNESSLLFNIQQCIYEWDLSSSTVFLSYLSHSHIFGFVTGFLVPLYLSAKLIIVSPVWIKENPQRIFNVVKKEQVNFTSLILDTIKLALKEPNDYDLSTIRYLALGGEKISPESFSFIEEKLSLYHLKKGALINSYGMSECGFVISQNRNDSGNCFESNNGNYCSVGTIDYNKIKIKIVDEKCNEKKDGDIGTIAISLPSIAHYYFSKKERHPIVQTTIENNDYFLTSDQGFIYNKSLYICDRDVSVVTYNGIKTNSQLLENSTNTIRIAHCADRILFLNIPHTVNCVVCFVFGKNIINKFSMFDEIQKLLTKKHQIKICDLFFSTIPTTGALCKLSYSTLLSDYVQSKIKNFDYDEDYSCCSRDIDETVGIIKVREKDNIAKTIFGDIPVVLDPRIESSVLEHNGLYRLYLKDKIVFAAKRLYTDTMCFTEEVDGHIYQLKPYYCVDRSDVKKLQADFQNNNERIIPTVLNNDYDTFFSKSKEMHTWDIDLPYVGSMIYFMYVDNQIVGSIDFRYALTAKLKYYGGHSGGAVMPSERGKKYASVFFIFSLKIAKHLGYKKIRLSCRSDNVAVHNILKNLNFQLVKSYQRTAEIIEDVYDIPL